MAPVSLDRPGLYANRELAWLAFNRRVLEEAQDPRNPILERVKFLAISGSNLDEFFEVRISALLQQIEDGYAEAGRDGLAPVQLRDRIARETRSFVDDQYACWNREILPALAQQGVRVLSVEELDAAGRAYIDDYCTREIDPLLTPITVDPAHPFPRVINKALCLAFLLRRRRRAASNYMGVVTVPRMLPRVVRVPNGDHYQYLYLADLVAYHAAEMYRGYEIISSAAFRVTRNSNLYLQEEEARSLLESVRSELHNRRKGDAVRLEIEAGAAPEITERLSTTFELDPWQVFHTDGPVNLSRLFHIYTQTQRADLKFKTFVPRDLHLTAKSHDLFHELRRHDVLLHHPFDNYDAIVSLIETAAADPSVLAIKQTVYRTDEESPVIEALIRAAAARKEVSVVVELKARFDEASNIRWARHLEDAGVQVFHGLVGLKTHCKLLLIVRKDPDGVTRRYAHLGTGNYNTTTARLYTDLSLLTADEEITGAVHGLFNFLTAYAERPDYAPLFVSPIEMAEHTIALIDREADHARAGRPARIIAKMNSLLDSGIVQALYRASQAGVETDLIVRGMCALRPGLRGLSENIRVRSIVGRFLEHTRIFYFENGGNEEVYAGSADWMPRNLYERVEVIFPIKDPMIRHRLRYEVLAAYLADNVKARILQRDGSYKRPDPRRRRPEFCAQDFLIAVAEGKLTADSIPEASPPRPRRARVRTGEPS